MRQYLMISKWSQKGFTIQLLANIMSCSKGLALIEMQVKLEVYGALKRNQKDKF